MSHFLTGVLEDLEEECHSAMVHDNMNFSNHMVHARRVEEARAKRKSRDANISRSFNGGSSKNSLEIQDKPRFKKWVSNKVPSKFPKARDEKGNKLRHKKGWSRNSSNEKTTYAM